MKLKQLVFQEFCNQLDLKIQAASNAFQEANESVLSETKGSVGDKHETGRAMAQLEVEKASKILNETKHIKSIIQLLSPELNKSKAELGALVETDLGIFYLSSGIGKIEVEDLYIYCIGMNAPIGKSLLNKKIDDQFTLGEKTGKILKIN